MVTRSIGAKPNPEELARHQIRSEIQNLSPKTVEIVSTLVTKNLQVQDAAKDVGNKIIPPKHYDDQISKLKRADLIQGLTEFFGLTIVVVALIVAPILGFLLAPWWVGVLALVLLNATLGLIVNHMRTSDPLRFNKAIKEFEQLKSKSVDQLQNAIPEYFSKIRDELVDLMLKKQKAVENQIDKKIEVKDWEALRDLRIGIVRLDTIFENIEKLKETQEGRIKSSIITI